LSATSIIKLVASNHCSPLGKACHVTPLATADSTRLRFGLSYSTFTISDLYISHLLADGSFNTQAVVTNTGSVMGSTVVQLYVGLPMGDITHPTLQLRGFVKVKNLGAGAQKKVQINLGKLTFAYWDESKAQWKVAKGEYTIKVGQSSEDLPLQRKVKVEKPMEWKGI
jgi:beta-glucosidase